MPCRPLHTRSQVLPRLALLLPTLRRFPSAAIVVPRHRPGGFIDQLLRLALPPSWLAPYSPATTASAVSSPAAAAAAAAATKGGRARGSGNGSRRGNGGRLIHYDTAATSAPGPRLEASQLLWADWPRVAARPTGAPIHCVAPQSALRAAAAMVKRGWRRKRARAANKTSWATEADEDEAGEAAAPCIVWARRGGAAKMRQLPEATEAALIARLKAAAAKAKIGFVDFDGGASSSSVEEAVALFSRATAVVGLHGGQLANVLFCTDGTLLVELTTAVASPFTSHYAHAAAALGLAYKAVALEPDERGVGAHELHLAAAAADAAVRRVEKHLKFFVGPMGHHRPYVHDEL